MVDSMCQNHPPNCHPSTHPIHYVFIIFYNALHPICLKKIVQNASKYLLVLFMASTNE